MTKERALMRAKQYRNWADARQKTLDALQKNHSEWTSQMDFTEPIKIGHHSQRRHERIFEKRNDEMRKIIDLGNSIKRMLEKANNLEAFASVNKGDAENRRVELRKLFDAKYKVGDELVHWNHPIQITRINIKTVSFVYTLGGAKSNEQKHLLWRENNR